MRFSFSVNIDRALEFSIYHSAPVARVKSWLRRFRFARVPSQPAKSMRIIGPVTIARPCGNVARLGVTVPDECFAVPRALIISFAARDFQKPEHYPAN